MNWNERRPLTPNTYVSELQKIFAEISTGLIEKGAVTVTTRMSHEIPGFLEIIFCHGQFVYKTVRNMRQVNDYRDNGQLRIDTAVIAREALYAIVTHRVNKIFD